MRLVASDEWRALPAEVFAKAGGVQRVGFGEWGMASGIGQEASDKWRVGCGE